uniref:DUF1653 domain-containing protein n=1 Tax=Strongyloides venezuelensis TaxID=75913 RepID=A0A0K0FMU9_STRVS
MGKCLYQPNHHSEIREYISIVICKNYLPVFITEFIPGKEGFSRNEIGSVPEDILTVALNKKFLSEMDL